MSEVTTSSAPQTSNTGLDVPDYILSGGEEVADDSASGEINSGNPGSEAEEASDEVKTGDEQEKEEAETDEDTDNGEDQDGGEEKKEEDGRPPKGFVEVQALKQAKETTKHFKQENLSLKEEITALKEQMLQAVTVRQKPSEFEGFELMNTEDLKELMYDDPDKAAQYVDKEKRFLEYQRDQDIEDQKSKAFLKDDEAAVQTAKEKIIEILVDNEAIADLEEAAIENGFSQSMFFLTDPETKIIVPGQSRPRSLGEGAAAVLGLIQKIKDSGNQKVEVTLDMVPDAVKAQIIEAAQDDIIKKAKGDTKTSGTKISDIPPSDRGGTDKLAGKPYSKMTEAERQEYLRRG